ncbi:hypothetical protein BGZ61DRAFT_551033 [Ilyonectria robusta]|uniref:uncharacterized protein n=1 Tax=Ilyonectria robusta TaxID=1079257 RepID=UPI001E8DFE64|nr:uncharacterized protein BGZ61DRAFT_551033 [Ilyonectria robusta]KAH8680260.1 hypothetical protein BGZ61DRAFT_551033 [Ilyonectria robusta]
MQDSTDEIGKRKLQLRDHIEDTIDRLHGHERQIENSGAKHRKERVQLYRDKEGPSWAYEGYKQLATRKVNDEFKLASDTIKSRIADSFARRRIRFEYLERHQKKRAAVILAPKQNPVLTRTVQPVQTQNSVIGMPELPQVNLKLPLRRLTMDQRTIYSATENTKLVMRPGPKPQERAESVASVALRHTGFPPPPKVTNGIFQCPYCRLEFRAREAEKSRWIQHVMLDFEPYFCLFEGCETPFEVPNSFSGLLSHLQEHLPLRWHADLPGGEHKEFDDEVLFEEHVRTHGGVSGDALAIMKETSLRRAAFLFKSCPFCGGYPDVIEKKYPNPIDTDAQLALRRHIKQHMHDIALFLPPYREDTFENFEEFNSSAVTRRHSIDMNNTEDTEEWRAICDNNDCDCKHTEKNSAVEGTHSDYYPFAATADDPMDNVRKGRIDPKMGQAIEEDSDFWPLLLDGSNLYDRSKWLNEDFGSDDCLKPFITEFFAQNSGFLPDSDSPATVSDEPRKKSRLEEEEEDSPQDQEAALEAAEANALPGAFDQATSLQPEIRRQKYKIAWICPIHIAYAAAKELLDEKHAGSELPPRNCDVDYTLGKMGAHYVVLVLWPRRPLSSQYLEFEAERLLSIFPNIEMKLIVGVAGGTPSPQRDMRLGDVVVNTMSSASNGLFCYDFDETVRARRFVTKELKYVTPAFAREVTAYQSTSIPISDLKYPYSLAATDERFSHPDAKSDVLYASYIRHPNKLVPCSVGCGSDGTRLVRRKERVAEGINPLIYDGVIASSTHRMEDAQLRDSLIEEMEVLCFEAFSAYLPSDFHDMIVHGICDYSDSHQYAQWEGYAALTSALYAYQQILGFDGMSPDEEGSGPLETTPDTQPLVHLDDAQPNADGPISDPIPAAGTVMVQARDGTMHSSRAFVQNHSSQVGRLLLLGISETFALSLGYTTSNFEATTHLTQWFDSGVMESNRAITLTMRTTDGDVGVGDAAVWTGENISFDLLLDRSIVSRYVVPDGSAPKEKSSAERYTATAQYDFTSDDVDDIQFVEGEKIVNIDKVSENWWLGTNAKGERGMFPRNYVTALETVTVSSITAVAEWDFEKSEDGEIGFSQGEYLTDITMNDRGWWIGTNAKGETGMFPGNRVYVILDGQASEADRALVTLGYNKAYENEIDLVKGEWVTNVVNEDENWMVATNAKGERGLFPSNQLGHLKKQAGTKAKYRVLLTPGVSAVAQWDWEGFGRKEIGFVHGDLITNIGDYRDSWLVGTTATGVRGRFPGRFVRLITEAEAARQRITKPNIYRDQMTIQEAKDIMKPVERTIFPYEGVGQIDLSFPAGAEITTIKLYKEGWLSGYYNGEFGIFPIDCIFSFF